MANKVHQFFPESARRFSNPWAFPSKCPSIFRNHEQHLLSARQFHVHEQSFKGARRFSDINELFLQSADQFSGSRAFLIIGPVDFQVSVHFREAKASSPFPYTRMPSKACETLLYPAVSHILRLVILPREYHNTSPPGWAVYAEIWKIRGSTGSTV